MMFLILSFVVNAGAAEIRIPVKGMICGFCSQGVVKKFEEEAAVEKVDVNLEKEMVTLVLKPGANLDRQRIEELIDDAGFAAGPIEHVR
jgi:mercuric ion binding protein